MRFLYFVSVLVAQGSCESLPEKSVLYLKVIRSNFYEGWILPSWLYFSGIFTFFSCRHLLQKKTKDSAHPHDGQKNLAFGKKITDGMKPTAFPLKRHGTQTPQNLFPVHGAVRDRRQKAPSLLPKGFHERKQGGQNSQAKNYKNSYILNTYLDSYTRMGKL